MSLFNPSPTARTAFGSPINTSRSALALSCAAARHGHWHWHWTRQSNRTAAAEVLAAVGDNEDRAAQAHAWAQNPEYRGKELLFARMSGAKEILQTLDDASQTTVATGIRMTKLKALVTDYTSHRVAFTQLPPRTMIDPPADPMRPVPDIGALNALAKTELTPEFLAGMKARGYTYENTATVINIRHGQTDGNLVSGGYFAGGIRGWPGPQLTLEAQRAASSLVPEIAKNASQISAVFVSPTDRALETYRRATQGVQFSSSTAVEVEVVKDASTTVEVVQATPTVFEVIQEITEHNIGGLFALKKPAKGAVTYESGVNGWTVGKTEDGYLGPDKNSLPSNYVPPVSPVYSSVPRVTPVRSEGVSESWDQMSNRIGKVVDDKMLPLMAKGKNILAFHHQHVMARLDVKVYRAEDGVGNDPMHTGEAMPNTAPQYWTAHVFKDAQGKLVVVPASVGQGQLAAPGLIPKGQTAPTTPPQ